MCHIPVFCWISATVLKRLFSETDREEIPRTLTEMYTHFLIFQASLKKDKYMKNYETKLNEYSKEFLLKLGKLAFDNLEKGNLIFYEEDLIENDIEVSEASVYSGVCTEVFKEEYGLYQEKVYCFVHLSIQEYLSAIYLFLSNSSADLLETAVDQALKSKNGHLDLYRRFLLHSIKRPSRNHLVCTKMEEAASEMRPPVECNRKSTESVLMERADSPVHSCVSLKSDASMDPPWVFREGPFPTDQR
nr:protein NLRC3-like [Paramormyrops kingsleyae]